MKPLIIANWKMNPSTVRSAEKLFEAVERGVKNVRNVDVVICPPFPYISMFHASRFRFQVGAQDCFWEEKGAFTGEVSPLMLKNLGCSYVILGHSERKRYVNETAEMVNKKLKAALAAGLIPVVCIGKDVEKEMRIVLRGIENWKLKIENLILVYEPEGAISTEPDGRATSPEQLERALSAMRGMLLKKIGKEAVQSISILYGGSVNSKNIRAFMQKGAQGALVGAASLDAQEFIQLVKHAISR